MRNFALTTELFELYNTLNKEPTNLSLTHYEQVVERCILRLPPIAITFRLSN
jgi:hypothetical protein